MSAEPSRLPIDVEWAIFHTVAVGRFIQFRWHGQIYRGRPVLPRGWTDTFHLDPSSPGWYREYCTPLIYDIPFAEVEDLQVYTR